MLRRLGVLRLAAVPVAAAALLSGCGAGSGSASSSDVGGRAPGVAFELESPGFAEAIAGGADVMAPEARTVPGVGVVLTAPAAVPFVAPSGAEDHGGVHAVGAQPGVQDAVIHFVPFDGGDPVRIRLPGAVEGRVRRVAGAAGVLERVVVALESCGSAYFHEEGDDRLLDCGLELWDLDPRSSRASALPVPEGVTDASLVPMAASTSLVRLSVGARVLELVGSAGGWKPVAAGSGAGCDLGDGTLVAVGADGAVERLSGEASEWRQIAEVPAPTGPITTLQCGPGVAYRTSVGRLPVVVVDQEGVRVVPSPVASATEVPGWVVDQVSGDLLLLGGRGIAARLPPDGDRFEELDVPMDRYEPSSGGGVRKPRAAELLDLDVHPDGTLVLGRF